MCNWKFCGCNCSNTRVQFPHVDDLFVIGMDGLIVDMKRKLVVECKMKDLGMIHYFLGMEVW